MNRNLRALLRRFALGLLLVAPLAGCQPANSACDRQLLATTHAIDDPTASMIEAPPTYPLSTACEDFCRARDVIMSIDAGRADGGVIGDVYYASVRCDLSGTVGARVVTCTYLQHCTAL